MINFLYMSKTSCILPTPKTSKCNFEGAEISKGVGLFEIFESGKKTSPSLRRPLLKSRGLLFSRINKI